MVLVNLQTRRCVPVHVFRCTHCDGCPHSPGNTSERLGIASAPGVDGPYTRPAKAFNLGNESVEVRFFPRPTHCPPMALEAPPRTTADNRMAA